MFARRSVARTAMLATLTLVAAQPAAAAVAEPDDCWRSDEIAAARVGDLQSTLMVLALKCQDTTPATLVAYNKFMADKHEVVVRDKYLIQAHFVRRLGPTEGMKASLAYDTRLGNQSSAPTVDVARCEKAGTHARLAAAATEDDLPVLAEIVAAPSALSACPVVVAKARPAAMVIPVWNRPAATAPAAAAAVPVAPTGAPAVAAVAPVPVATPVAAPPAAAAPASQADAVRALQAAVAALSQVAASMQPAAPVPTPTPVSMAETEE